jgi:hypothetical protein
MYILSVLVAQCLNSAIVQALGVQLMGLQRPYRNCFGKPKANIYLLNNIGSSRFGTYLMHEPNVDTSQRTVPQLRRRREMLVQAAAAPSKQKSNADGTPSNSASVQYMITNKMRQTLIDDLAYLPAEVEEMEPEVARIVISKRLRRPPSGMPKAWSKASNASRLAKRSSKTIFRVIADPFIGAVSVLMDAISSRASIEGIKIVVLSACFGFSAYKIFYSDDSLLHRLSHQGFDRKAIFAAEDYTPMPSKPSPCRAFSSGVIDAERLNQIQNIGLGEKIGIFFNLVKNKYF